MADKKELDNVCVVYADTYNHRDRFDVELFRKQQLKMLPEDYDTELVETAGFEPLDVKLYKMHQAGIRAMVNVSDFTMQDMRDIYLNPDFTYDEGMEIEEIEEIERQRLEFIKVLEEKKKTAENDAVSLSEAEKDKFSRYFKQHMEEFRAQLEKQNSPGEDKSKGEPQAHGE